MGPRGKPGEKGDSGTPGEKWTEDEVRELIKQILKGL
jgi:hypothetical protein